MKYEGMGEGTLIPHLLNFLQFSRIYTQFKAFWIMFSVFFSALMNFIYHYEHL